MKLGIEGVMSDYCTKIEKLIFKEYSSGIDDVLPSVEVNVGGKKYLMHQWKHRKVSRTTAAYSMKGYCNTTSSKG